MDLSKSPDSSLRPCERYEVDLSKRLDSSSRPFERCSFELAQWPIVGARSLFFGMWPMFCYGHLSNRPNGLFERGMMVYM
jgi:hypothetical protein